LLALNYEKLQHNNHNSTLTLISVINNRDKVIIHGNWNFRSRVLLLPGAKVP